ncbi:STAS domain-containing protein [Noviherbaspirillum cavernae]|uniref:STAS domain-containing protein n=1 Tax=Noviherbaspirillum cavernae TaxID=2320862 RepID=A0A418X6Y6_9BURK|nr:STAS domain-containing protein [Noviherbaspirillum cavernae]RJG08121.1 STAS domain-containing protein [Noviherbaspirillum cavernae]
MFRPALTLTVSNAKTVLEDGLRAIGAGQVAFDLAEVTVVDSAAVATLLAWQRAARRKGTPLEFRNLPVNLQGLLELYGVAELLHAASPAEPRADLLHH